MSDRIEAEKFAQALGLPEEALEALEGGEYETEFEVYDDDILILPGREADTVVVGYMSHDDSPSDFWDDRAAGELKIFKSESDRDAFSKEVKRARKTSLVVDRYKHGNVHYSVRDTANYADRRWDVAPCGVYVPDDEAQKRHRSALRKASALPEGAEREAAVKEATDILVKEANGTLDEYSDWCNGEVYGIAIETWTYDRASGLMIQSKNDACWNYIGHSSTREELERQVAALARPEPTEPSPTVHAPAP